MKRMFALLLMLTTCACQGRERLLSVAQLPPPPVSLARPVTNYPMLPEIRCLQETGSPTSPLCPLIGSSVEPNKPIWTAPKS